MFGYALSVTFACGKTLYYLFVGITTVANKGKYYVVRLQYIIYISCLCSFLSLYKFDALNITGSI